MSTDEIRIAKAASARAKTQAKVSKMESKLARIQVTLAKRSDREDLARRGVKRGFFFRSREVPVKSSQTVKGPRRSFWRKITGGSEPAAPLAPPASPASVPFESQTQSDRDMGQVRADIEAEQ